MRRRTPRADADGDDAVLVRVWAAGVNPINGKVQDGYRGADGAPRFPLVPGAEDAGIIERVGPSVERVGVCVKLGAGTAVFGEKGIRYDPQQ
jgi:NADPH:quinone reductase-like Zn-dependent oxidoreductase